MIEVVVHFGWRFHEAHADVLAKVRLDLHVSWQRRHTQGDMLERPSLSWRFCAEQRELAATRVRSNQGEIVLLVDDVHAETAS